MKSLEKMKREDDNNSVAVHKNLDAPITMQELKMALARTNQNSAPGLDQISFLCCRVSMTAIWNSSNSTINS